MQKRRWQWSEWLSPKEGGVTQYKGQKDEPLHLGPGSLWGPTAGWAVKVGGDSKGNCGVLKISLVAGVPRVVGPLGWSPEGILCLLPAIFGAFLFEYCVCALSSSGISCGQWSPLSGAQPPRQRAIGWLCLLMGWQPPANPISLGTERATGL